MKVTSSVFYGISIFISIVIAPYYLILGGACIVLTQPFLSEVLQKIAEVLKLTAEELSSKLMVYGVVFAIIFVLTIVHSVLCYKASNRNSLPWHIVTMVFGAMCGVATTIVAGILGIVYWAIHRGGGKSAASSEPPAENA